MKTLYDKIWDAHRVCKTAEGNTLIYIDRQLLHEVTSPQAFAGMQARNRKIRRPETLLAVSEHNVPTLNRRSGISDPESRRQIQLLQDNCHRTGITYLDLLDVRQGIVHVTGPEQGFTLPGITLVCGDSHTSTHGAFGALAFGIGTSEIEHVFATQTLNLKKAKNMRIELQGTLPPGITAKDVILALIAHTGTAGATGHVIEFTGLLIKTLSMEARMTLCNMAIEAGARSGLIAPDETTFAYLQGSAYAPREALWPQALAYWRTLQPDSGAYYDKEITLEVSTLAPQVTWGTSPESALPIDALVPDPKDASDAAKHDAMQRALDYMGLRPGMPLQDIKIDTVFIGSCTNARIEDLRSAAQVIAGRTLAPGVRGLVVPGSGLVKEQAEQEGLARLFTACGFEWREPGCSMCLAMNGDRLAPGERCASTSNRNFEGRQGRAGRTHLMSPAMAAAAAVTGRLTDIRALL